MGMRIANLILASRCGHDAARDSPDTIAPSQDSARFYWQPTSCAPGPPPKKHRSGPGAGFDCEATFRLQTPVAMAYMRRATTRLIAASPFAFGAGWSSPVARQAHNLKVTG